mgnify:CR=1 FL=1
MVEIKRCAMEARNDEKGLAACYVRQKEALKHYIASRIDRPDEAEDVVQDVFEKLLRYEGRFESEEHLKAWLLRVAINRCRDLTRAARQKDTELDENIPAPDPTEDGSVLDAVRALPENYRNAVYLHYYEGYTAAEVGRMLGAPTNTVLSWLRRARAQLHTMLKEEIEDEVV